jgi:hypothetical protein
VVKSEWTFGGICRAQDEIKQKTLNSEQILTHVETSFAEDVLFVDQGVWAAGRYRVTPGITVVDSKNFLRADAQRNAENEAGAEPDRLLRAPVGLLEMLAPQAQGVRLHEKLLLVRQEEDRAEFVAVWLEPRGQPPIF